MIYPIIAKQEAIKMKETEEMQTRNEPKTIKLVRTFFPQRENKHCAKIKLKDTERERMTFIGYEGDFQV